MSRDHRLRKQVDRIKQLAFDNTRSNKQDLRFEGPDQRKHSWRLAVLNADVVDLSKFVRQIYPCAVFLRASRESVDSSRLDVYIPTDTGLRWWLLSVTCWVVSLACFFACAYTLGHRR
jgi:hypothetical protein